MGGGGLGGGGLGLGARASGKKGVESRVSGIKNVLTDSRRLLYFDKKE